ncbi:alginate O-acetyltransferase, partial [Pseudomonas koreensis]
KILKTKFPKLNLHQNKEIADSDPQWVAELKQAGARQQNVAINTKSETPDRAQN